MKRLLLFIVLLSGLQICYSQDTVSVFFETGSSKLNEAMTQKLNDMVSAFDLNELDSVLFVGLADSTGATDFNIRLSEKRARAVARYCEKLIPETVYSGCIAKGESNANSLDDNRRVDVILYFPDESDSVVSSDTAAESLCYSVDYYLLHRCSTTKISKGKKNFILIQTFVNVKDTIDYYSGSINNKGDFTAKKIKWSLTKQKHNVRGSTCYSAKIPAADFERFRLFRISQPPCDSCNEDFQQSKQIQHETTCFQVDRFLMKSLQIRTTPFRPRSVNIRVARELVNLNEKYFIDCSTDSLVKWTVKGGKRRAGYLYSTLPEYPHRIANITRYMPCCEWYSEPSQCDWVLLDLEEAYFCRDLLFDFESGVSLMPDSARFFAGVGLNKSFYRSQFYLMAGLNDRYDFFGTFRFRHHFLLLPLSGMNPFYVWQSPGSVRYPLYYSLYAGTEVNLSEKPNSRFGTGQNVHLGFSLCSLEDAFLQSVYIQGGMAFDYSAMAEDTSFPFVQCGIQLKIVSSRSKFK